MAFIHCKCGFIKNNIPDEHIGKRAKCPKCKDSVLVEKDKAVTPESMSISSESDKIVCPKCKHEQPITATCLYCGIVIDKYLKSQTAITKKEKDETKENKETSNKIDDGHGNIIAKNTGYRKLVKIFSILVIILLFSGIYLVSKSKFHSKGNLSELLTLIDVLNVESHTKTIWDLAFAHSKLEYKPKDNQSIIQNLTNFLQIRPEKNNRKGEIAEYDLTLKYRDKIIQLLNNFGTIGSELGLFLCDKKDIPIRFASFNNDVCLLITKIASGTTYNTLRTTPKSRVAKVLTSHILPSIRYFYNSFKDSEISYYSMIIVFGSKDFTNELSLKAEAISIVVSKNNCRQFINAEISDTEFIDKSEIFVSDRDMLTFKKVKVILE